MVPTLPVKVPGAVFRGCIEVGRVQQAVVPGRKSIKLYHFWRRHMWTKPEFTEMRFGFEVTMYIANR
jgi:coenzyme PQQ precursor peptide PqqA